MREASHGSGLTIDSWGLSLKPEQGSQTSLKCVRANMPGQARSTAEGEAAVGEAGHGLQICTPHLLQYLQKTIGSRQPQPYMFLKRIMTLKAVELLNRSYMPGQAGATTKGEAAVGEAGHGLQQAPSSARFDPLQVARHWGYGLVGGLGGLGPLVCAQLAVVACLVCSTGRVSCNCSHL